jgi:site-specific DNA-methyltransferase (adenine-specific)
MMRSGLLERIIQVGSNKGDVVLDPFCGCGTAVHAAQKLERQWIGIDITHLAISLVEKRLRDAFPGTTFNVEGTPVDVDGARDLALRNKYQFQWWACHLVNAQPYQGKKKGADGGIDGLIFFEDEKGKPKRVLVSVKGGENVGLTMVKDLIATVQGEKAQVGLFVTLTPPTKPMIAEAARAGYYDSALGKSYPRIQILTIEGLMAGTERPQYPLAESGGLTFKRAKVELRNTQQHELFGRASAEIAALPLSALVTDEPEDES